MLKRVLCTAIVLTGMLFSIAFQADAASFTVVIDAGHGGKDPGTLGSSCKEKDIVLAVALKLGHLIQSRQSDVQVIYTRSSDVFIPLNQRANIANKAKANLFISIHADHSDSPRIKGASTFTLGQNRTAENMAIAKRENSVILLEDNYKQRYEGFDPNSPESYIMFEFMQDNYMNQSVNLATTLQNKFTASGRIDRGVRQDVFLVLRCTSMPSVLVEVGFLSNQEEEQYLKSEAGQDETAESLYRGFSEFRAGYERKSTNKSSLTSAPAGDEPNRPSVRPDKEDSTPPKETSANVEEHKTGEPEQKENSQNETEFRVQILASDVALSSGSKKLKGVDATFYTEKNYYKYTVGSFRTFAEANRKRRELSGLFPDAFVIAFRNGQKIAVEKARADSK